MNLLVLSHMYPHALQPTFGLFVHQQVKELSRHCDVMAVSPTPYVPRPMRRLKSRWAAYASKPGSTILDGVSIHYPRYLHIPSERGFPFSAYFYWWAISGYLRRLRSTFRFDLVHAHAVLPDGFAAARIGQRMAIPAVCTSHGADLNVYPHRTRLTNLLTREALASIDVVVTVSRDLRDRALTLGATDGAVRVISNGVDTSRFAPIDQAAARSELGLRGDGPLLVYASRLARAKGLSFLLAALRMVLECYPNCHLALVGEGPARNLLERQVREMRLESAVIFAGQRPHHEIALWMNAGDLIVHPSLVEGSPLPIYEAMACGRPIVATSVGGIPETVPSEECGLLVRPADPGALAEALLKAIAREWDPGLIRSHGASKTWGQVADQLLGLYAEMLTNRGRHPSTHGVV